MAAEQDEQQRALSLGTLRLGSPFGIPVTVSVGGTLLIVILVATTLAKTVRVVVPGADPGTALVVGAIGGILLQLSILVHEISHCIVARLLGLTVRGLHLRLVAGVTEIEGELEDPRSEYLVAMAGPLATVLLACFGGIGYCLSGVPDPHGSPYGNSGSAFDVLVVFFVLVNVLLAIYNLLPGMPLDGGRVLRSAVWALTGKVWTGTYVAGSVGEAISLATLVLGVHDLVAANAREGFVTILAGVYVGVQATTALQQARLEQVTPRLDARALLRRCVAVPAEMPLGEALRRAALVGATSAVVTDASGRPTMVLQGSELDKVPENRRPWVPVSSVCTLVATGMVLDVRLSGRLLLEALQTRPASEYVVVDRDGEHGTGVVGVIATVDVAAMVLRGRYRSRGA